MAKIPEYEFGLDRCKPKFTGFSITWPPRPFLPIHEVKQMSRVPEKWRALAHAEIDGAVIHVKGSNGNWIPKQYPDWLEDGDYRVDPKCEYALAKIPKKHHDVYLQWCDGAEIESLFNGSWGSRSWELNDNKWMECFDLRVKPKTIRRWQWLVIKEGRAHVHEKHMSESEAQFLTMTYRRAPTCRKIEETMREDEA